MTSGHPVAPGFVMDITIGDASDMPRFITPRDQHMVEDVVTAMGKAAAAYLVAVPECEAYALRLTAVPIEIREAS